MIWFCAALFACVVAGYAVGSIDFTAMPFSRTRTINGPRTMRAYKKQFGIKK